MGLNIDPKMNPWSKWMQPRGHKHRNIRTQNINLSTRRWENHFTLFEQLYNFCVCVCVCIFLNTCDTNTQTCTRKEVLSCKHKQGLRSPVKIEALRRLPSVGYFEFGASVEGGGQTGPDLIWFSFLFFGVCHSKTISWSSESFISLSAWWATASLSCSEGN